MSSTFERLPTNIVPEHYVCEFEIDPTANSFKGKTSINLQVTEN